MARTFLFLSLTLLVDTGASEQARNLFTLRDPLSRSLELCCDPVLSVSCHDVDVDVEALHDKEDITFGKYTLKFSNSIPPHGQVYKSDKGDEAVISYSPDTNTIIGSLMTEDGKSFALEKCGKNYIFEEFELPHSTGKDYFPGPNHTLDGMEIMRATVKVGLGLRQRGPKSYSVMFYYTPEFAKITTYIDNFFDFVIEKANQGYANSQMPIVVTKLCTELMDIDENGGNLLGRFEEFKGSAEALRNTADVAVLFSVGGLGDTVCGKGYIRSDMQGKPAVDWPFSVTRKSCAKGGVTFHHEIGHNFGCEHDRIVDAPASGDAYGHHIEAGNGHNGLRTVMAYETEGHSEQVNYFSNPNVIHPLTGTPTGIRGKADCAGVHMKNIDYIAALGDESATCKNCNLRSGSINLRKYKNNYRQVWDLCVPAGSRIQLIFYLFDLELGSNCRFDYVEVFTGSSSQKYCGKKKPFLLTSSGNTMKIKFVSDHSVTKRGIYAQWRAI